MSNSVTIQCEDVLNIAGVSLLHQDLKTAINDVDEIILKAENVERIDAATLQLFAALFNDSEKLGVVVRWDNPSEAIINSARTLGLLELLKIEH
ncbi:MAG: lipid asymmetry maintenance protein MlaB [Gammaproteobacteria bacterium]